MAKPTYIQRLTDGRTRYRREIPPELRDLPEFGGNKWITRELTGDDNTVRQQAAVWAAEDDRRFADAKRKLTRGEAWDIGEINRAIARWQQDELRRRSNAYLMRDPGDRRAEIAQEEEVLTAGRYMQHFQRDPVIVKRLLDAANRTIAQKAAEILEPAGIQVPPDRHPAHSVVWHLVQSAWRQVVEQDLGWCERLGAVEYTPGMLPDPNRSMTITARTADLPYTVAEVVDRYTAETGADPSTVTDVVKLLEDTGLCPNLFRDINQATVYVAKGLLVERYVVGDKYERVDGETGVKLRSSPEVEAKFKHLTDLFDWAFAQGIITTNPAAKVNDL